MEGVVGVSGQHHGEARRPAAAHCARRALSSRKMRPISQRPHGRQQRGQGWLHDTAGALQGLRLGQPEQLDGPATQEREHNFSVIGHASGSSIDALGLPHIQRR